MTLQFSQSFLTDALTFINSFNRRHNAALGQVVRRHFHFHSVPNGRALEGQTPLARNIGQQPVAIGQLDAKQSCGQNLHYPAFSFNGVFAGHVKISGSTAVINTVCSKWADS